MTAVIFEYPQSAIFGRVLPKSKIYEHAAPSSNVRKLFIRQVDQIIWQYKLSAETINLKSTRAVPEIQILSITLKTGDLTDDILRCIDQAVSFPIIFELNYEDRVQTVATYKRRSDADPSKWVMGQYFRSVWFQRNAQRKLLPVVFDLNALYEQLLFPLMPFPARASESLQACVERMQKIGVKQREIHKCEICLHKEKQFNQKMVINAELRNLKIELDELTRIK